MAAVLRDHEFNRLDVAWLASTPPDIDTSDIAHLARLTGVAETPAMERAADWAGLAFVPEMPKIATGSVRLDTVDAIAQCRAVAATLGGREVIFAAPNCREIVALRALVTADPGLRRHFCLVPRRSLETRLTEALEAEITGQARNLLEMRWPSASAAGELKLPVRLAFALMLVVAVGALGLAPVIDRQVLMPLAGLVLVVPGLLRMVAAAMVALPEPISSAAAEAELPVYSVLVPLRDEAHMVAPLAGALRRLDYPPDRLDVIFAVEADSTDTVRAARAELADARFRLVEIPPGAPRTKPKALNYALPLARGRYLAVYDAEDIPDPGQLREAAAVFAARPELDCLQAELVVDNGQDNILTALFAGEYAGQFGLMLPLLARLGLPMPLGGTSNHFRVSALKEVGGWDAYNVTEDADLGVRFARLRYRTGTLSSRTREEVPHRLGPWLRQRTRWMKGWMQVLIVHNRHPATFLGDIGRKGFVAFQIYVGSLILSGPLHLVFLVALAIAAAGRGAQPPDPSDTMVMLTLLVGYGGPMLLALVGLERLGRRDMMAPQLLLPAYWLLHAAAAGLALIDLVRRPYFWAKTAHGTARPRRLRRQVP